MRITPPILIACYEFLRTVPPFMGWKLPEADEVGFEVARFYHFGECDIGKDGNHIIRISENSVSHADTLLRTMAHEMIHVRHGLIGTKTIHGKEFKKDAAKVARFLGFDPKEL